jgi:GT2 family glycosyltransferase
LNLTVGVKALNEEEHIEACLASALSVVRRYGGEVVLADSGSTDATVAIARQMNVRIVQLADAGDRSCGAGAQLAYQFAKGDYFYLIDGDMIMHEDFVGEAVAYLHHHPEVAAVGGRIIERNVINEEFRIRNAALSSAAEQVEEVDRLDGGGVYRMSALRPLGYFTDRNLHSFEEFELAARLRNAGWKLVRLNCPAVDHFGHRISGYNLLWRRLKSGYAHGLGETLRSAIGTPQFRLVVTGLSHIRHATVVLCWWLVLLACALSGAVTALAVVAVAPLLFLAARRRSISLGLYSYVSWNVNALGLITGIFRRRTNPSVRLKAMEMHSP